MKREESTKGGNKEVSEEEKIRKKAKEREKKTRNKLKG